MGIKTTWALISVLALMLIVSLTLAIAAVFGFVDHVSAIEKNYLSLLPGISITCGGLIALLAYVRDKQHQTTERSRKSEEIYLDLARKSFDEVFELLKDKNNDRIIWVRAARLLLDAKALKNKIDTADVLDAFSIAEEKLRTELYRTLSLKSEENHARESLPPQFFYGIDEWDSEISLGDAAIKGTSGFVVSSLTIDKNHPEPMSSLLADESVIAIYNFLRFPDDYDDPLKKVEVWDGNWEDSNGIEQGPRRYIAHRQRFAVINGKLHEKPNKNGQHDGAKDAPLLP